jgi:hypothetical protein
MGLNVYLDLLRRWTVQHQISTILLDDVKVESLPPYIYVRPAC